MKFNKRILCLVLVILFHAVGLAGFLIPSLTPLFIRLVPYHLLLMLALIIWSHPHKNTEFIAFVGVTFIAGFIVEVLGVATGLIFGRYQYGNTLGIKVADVPLMIGVNWVILVYCTGVVMKKVPIRSTFLKSLIGALLMVFIDILIEPVAVRFDYWSWADFNVPFQNYVAWFVFSFSMLMIFFARKFRKVNIVGMVMLLAQVAFFAALNFWAI